MVAERNDSSLDQGISTDRTKKSRSVNFTAFAVPFILATLLLTLYGDEAFKFFDKETSDALSSVERTETITPEGSNDSSSTGNERIPLLNGDVSLGIKPSSSKKESESVSVEKEHESVFAVDDSNETAIDIPNADSDSVSLSENEVDELAADFGANSDGGTFSEEEFEKNPLTDNPPIAFDFEGAERDLAQLEFQFSQIKERDVRELYNAEDLVEPIFEKIKALNSIENAPIDFLEKVRNFQQTVETFRDSVLASQSFYQSLEPLDEASLDAASSRAFFAKYADAAYKENVKGADAEQYCKEFATVAKTLDACDCVDQWNEFISREGDSLESFYIGRDAAAQILQFLKEHHSDDGVPQEFDVVKRRTNELQFAANNDVATQRKVILRLESELSKKYWTYAASFDKIYYLDAPARSGQNEYIADEHGTRKLVDIPDDASEIQASESPQKVFLRSLSDRAREISDDLRGEDVARWYVEWSDFLRRIQTTEELDPIVQYVIFRDVAQILSSSDYFFSRRLAPLLKIMNAPQLEKDVDLLRWSTDDPKTIELRLLARGRVSFLPKDHLVVDKTTAQLNAQTVRCYFLYERVGWLDRSLDGSWICRRPSNAEIPTGELFALRLESENPPKFVWRELGVSDGRQLTINAVSTELPRGAIVFCRVRAKNDSQVANRSSLESLFMR